MGSIEVVAVRHGPVRFPPDFGVVQLAHSVHGREHDNDDGASARRRICAAR
jgi:hypothetical protein